ncbi:hypothetical protein Ttaiw_00763 [Tepidimonas taiwanensis]|uniref:Serine protease n=1 Tax=Tepidimonas taiwanensis TaxID=307486 RepID=A0A554XBQ1_9BURK|nr:hypothetical protein Ttaiw_00763 [Tepidimonas taiwanensis]
MQPKTIAEQLFFSTVRIDTVTADGAQGAGTGFFFGHKFGGDKQALFVVTNCHIPDDHMAVFGTDAGVTCTTVSWPAWA